MNEKSFPSPQQRAQLLARRNELEDDCMAMLARHAQGMTIEETLRNMPQKYQPSEVETMVKRIVPMLTDALRKSDEERSAWLYETYIGCFRRFGGTRRFLQKDEYLVLYVQFNALYKREAVRGRNMSVTDRNRMLELEYLLMPDAYLWDDITPDDPPPHVDALPKPKDA